MVVKADEVLTKCSYSQVRVEGMSKVLIKFVLFAVFPFSLSVSLFTVTAIFQSTLLVSLCFNGPLKPATAAKESIVGNEVVREGRGKERSGN